MITNILLCVISFDYINISLCVLCSRGPGPRPRYDMILQYTRIYYVYYNVLHCVISHTNF